jgi:ATP-dependent Lon protease
VPTLLGFFETEQRKSLLENFLDVEVDFSGFIIFTTTNNIENLTPALKSRIVSFTVEKPSPEQMKIIGQNIYQKHIQERDLQEILANKIPLQCENHYLDVVPRQAKQIIESAIRKAIQRYDVNNPELISLGIHDFVSVFNNQSNHIGFIH